MRVRINAWVEESLIDQARRTLRGGSDSQVIDAALTMFLNPYRSAEIDAAYAKYDEMPLSTPDEWGDLESWHEPTGGTQARHSAARFHDTRVVLPPP